MRIYKGLVVKRGRRDMNAVFVMNNATIRKEFIDLCKQEGIVGVKGHRSVGGFSFPSQNALKYEINVTLTDLMKTLQDRKCNVW